MICPESSWEFIVQINTTYYFMEFIIICRPILQKNFSSSVIVTISKILYKLSVKRR